MERTGGYHAGKTRCSDATGGASAAIKKGICGTFVFFGDEDYLKSRYRDEIYQSVMTEGMETFNYFAVSFSPAAGSRENA